MSLREAYIKLKQLESCLSSQMNLSSKSKMETLRSMDSKELEAALEAINTQHMIFSKVKDLDHAEKEIEQMRMNLEKVFPAFKVEK